LGRGGEDCRPSWSSRSLKRSGYSPLRSRRFLYRLRPAFWKRWAFPYTRTPAPTLCDQSESGVDVSATRKTAFLGHSSASFRSQPKQFQSAVFQTLSVNSAGSLGVCPAPPSKSW